VRQGERFLAEAGVLLAASLDYRATLMHLARLAVPKLGDWCAIDLVDDDQSVHRVAVVHSDPLKVELARDLAEGHPFGSDPPRHVVKVLSTGRSEFYPDLPDGLVARSRDADLTRELGRHGLGSVICVPLVARGRTLGAITLALAEPGRRYSRTDLAFAEAVGRRAGLAVDNARLYAELQKANEAKDEFLGLVSHELRTPITTIYGGARLLRSRSDLLAPETKAEILADIEQEAERLHRIVENLLVLSRIELGRQLPTEPVLVQRVIEKVARNFQQRRPGRQLAVHADPDLEPVASEPTSLELILGNLLGNSDKYSPGDTPIEIQARRNGDGSVAVAVLDRGPGISVEEADRIFETFYRSDTASRKAKGKGIGLTVCKRLVEAQAGRIWATPRQGGGLEVAFTLPICEEVPV
jgi:K+-sensing histidine kinase KdpD